MAALHIRAKRGDVAEAILLPGDPRRAKYIAENYLENPVRFNDARGMYGYTGYYNKKRVSVMGTGMGIPSISVYASELIKDFGVKTLIRVGTCGSYCQEIGLMDIILAEGCCTDSAFLREELPGDFAPLADFSLLTSAYEKSVERGIKTYVGLLKSSDLFYPDTEDEKNKWSDYGVLGVEMEGAGLYAVAAKYGVRALTICSVSDSSFTKDELTSKERESSLDYMITLALETACETIKEGE
ncbi:MAG: purine-nucleoside phosphorylase [Ruminococcaceae bacterium]|nr:purine-nucleoside phosphorylase [Oscillospiraceae bacterium]